MNGAEILRDKIETAETVSDIERLDLVADALAAQALGRSQILMEQFDLKSFDRSI